ncbi:MAG: transposase [Parvularcula sp.]|jgi:IS5 family transposase|nr:transposase [Parvularcula sp.]
MPAKLFIDSSCIEVHRAPGGARGGGLAHGIGDHQGGGTKLHTVCNEKGRPHILLLTPGNTHDARIAMLAINTVPPSKYLVADKGYDSNALRS